MILNKGKAIGIMIDMQDKLVPAIAHSLQLGTSCKLMLEGLKILNVPVIATQQYTKGLGDTLPELKEFTGGKYIEKITFSSWREQSFRMAVRETKASQIMIFGVETHICVEQTVLNMLGAGLEVYLISDCVGSRFDTDKETAIRRMEKAGAIVTTSEAALFELTEQGGTDEFKAISRLVKSREF